ncbi:MAG: serine hydrolase [Bacillota bacterium]
MDRWAKLQKQVEEISSTVTGTIGVAVKDLSTAEEFHQNAGEVYPLASVFKIPVLVELYRQAGAGLVNLDERYALAEEIKSFGSGVLREFRAGATLTLWDYALLMIIISDNTATDQVMKVIGATNIDPTLQKLGLTKTSVTLDCYHLLCDMAEIDPALPRDQALALARDKFLERPETAVYPEPTSNFSTPLEMNLLLEKILEPGGTRSASGELILGPEEQAGVLDILLRQQLRLRLPHLLPRGTMVAHKTGTLPGVFNDCGIVYGDHQGKKPAYLISLMSKGVTDALEGPMVLARISRAVYDALMA